MLRAPPSPPSAAARPLHPVQAPRTGTLCRDPVQGPCAGTLCRDPVQGPCTGTLCRDPVQGPCAGRIGALRQGPKPGTPAAAANAATGPPTRSPDPQCTPPSTRPIRLPPVPPSLGPAQGQRIAARGRASWRGSEPTRTNGTKPPPPYCRTHHCRTQVSQSATLGCGACRARGPARIASRFLETPSVAVASGAVRRRLLRRVGATGGACGDASAAARCTSAESLVTASPPACGAPRGGRGRHR